MAALVGAFWKYPVPDDSDPGGRNLVQGWNESAAAARAAKSLAHERLVTAFHDLLGRITLARGARDQCQLRRAIYSLGFLTEPPAPAFHLRVCCLLIADRICDGQWPSELDDLLDMVEPEAERLTSGVGYVSADLQAAVAGWQESMRRLEAEERLRDRSKPQ